MKGSARERRLSMLGFVFQFHFLLPEFTARENVEIPMRKLGRLARAEMRERAGELLSSLGLGDHLDKRPDQLSGGQRQRVAVARSLANDPPLILADEPTGSLDSKSSEQVFAILEAWCASAARPSSQLRMISTWRRAWTAAFTSWTGRSAEPKPIGVHGIRHGASLSNDHRDRDQDTRAAPKLASSQAIASVTSSRT